MVVELSLTPKQPRFICWVAISGAQIEMLLNGRTVCRNQHQSSAISNQHQSSAIRRVLVRELVCLPILNIKLLTTRETIKHGVVGNHPVTVLHFLVIVNALKYGFHLTPTASCVCRDWCNLHPTPLTPQAPFVLACDEPRVSDNRTTKERSSLAGLRF